MMLDHEPLGLERITPISQHGIDGAGYHMRDILIAGNPLLTPAELKQYISAYGKFHCLTDGLMWQHEDSQQAESNSVKKYDQVFLLLSGIPATGKHDLLLALESLLKEPSVGLITDTTRPPKEITVIRDGKEMKIMEIHGVHHNFLTEKQFIEKSQRGEYIEWIEERPGKFYGTPVTAPVEAFHQNKPLIITDLEIASGWAQIERYVATLPPQDRPKIL